jgi:signal peptidase I
MSKLFLNILISIVILFVAWWFHFVWIPLLVFVLLWIKWYYRKSFNAFWGGLKQKHKTTFQLGFGSIILSLGLIGGILIYRFGIELISVPSPSMEKAIHAGKYIFVNKLVPGPRRFPEDIEKYFRMAGMASLERGDIVLFNFPEGDTILENRPNESYYYLKRHYNNFDRLRKIRKWGKLGHLNVRHRPRFVKRLAALPGDTVEIRAGMLYVNNKEVSLAPTVIKKFKWFGDEEAFRMVKDRVNIINHYQYRGDIVAEMTMGTYCKLPSEIRSKFSPAVLEKNVPDRYTFPFNIKTGWNTDFMGPVKIPARGDTIALNSSNYDSYERAIRVYENNKLEKRNGTFYINGIPQKEYCFKLDYYWVMGDNQPHSFDSRYWGFLPENHIIGKIPKEMINLGE